MDEDEYIHGSGNIFRDFGYPDAGLRHAKVMIAVEIARVLDEHKGSTYEAASQTGVSRVEFLRIRCPDLNRLTLDRLLEILSILGSDVTVSVEVKTRRRPSDEKLSIAVHRAA